jgi:hypothetical protein
MSTTNQFKTALIDTSPAQKTALYDALSKRGAYVIVTGEDATDLIPPPLCTHLIYNGLVFWYDATDATTAHDGVTCIVTFDAKRFKTDAYNGRGILTYAVKDKDLATPPGSPTIGDAYIVAAGGTGAWATKDKKIAVYTARSWVFIQPNTYWEAFVIDESLYYHYSAGAVWTSGLPGIVLPASGVRIGNLKYGLGLRVFNQTTTAPPGSPAEGDAYIVGTGGTGAWAGHDGKIAIWETASWTILVPVDGWTVYDTSVNRAVYYDGGGWINPVAGPLDWQVIDSGTDYTNVAAIDYVNLGAWKSLRMNLYEMRPVGASGVVAIRTSSNNGVSFDAAATDYFQNAVGAAQFATSTAMLNTLRGFTGQLIFDSFNAAAFGSMVLTGTAQISAVNFAETFRGGGRVQATARNAFRIIGLTTNITGRVTLEGRNP